MASNEIKEISMTSSVISSSSSSSSCLWLQTSALNLSPEEKVDRTEEDALAEADHLPKKQQTSFKAMIRNAMAQIRSRIAEMRAKGRIEYEINKVVDDLLQDFHLSKANFLEQTAQYDINKGLVRKSNQSIRNSLLQCNPDFRPILLMDFDDEPLSLDQEPLQQTTTPKLEERKTQLAQCIQTTMDPESFLGAIPCVAQHSQGLSKSEQKELDDFVPKAIVGKTINEIAMSFASTSKAINAVVTPIFKAWALSAMSESVLAAEPHRYNERMAEMRRALRGGDPEFNKMMRSMTPQWALQTAHYLSHANLRLAEFDRYMNQEYRTVPGLIHEGCLGGVDIGLMAVGGVAIKTFKQAAVMTGRGVRMGLVLTAQAAHKTSRTVYRALKEAPKVKPVSITLISNTSLVKNKGTVVRFLKDESGALNPPLLSRTKAIVEMATELTGDGATSEINVARVMNSGAIVHYESNPITKFVENTLRGHRFRLVREVNALSGNEVYYVYNLQNQPLGVIKDYISTRSTAQGFVPEMVSYAFLQSKKLQEAALPAILAVGKYAAQGSERGLVMYEFVPGETVAALFSGRRNIPAREIGKAFGEINRITSGAPVSGEYLENKIRFLSLRAMSALDTLESLGISTQLSMREVVMISRDVRRNPGIGAVAHGDAHPGNVIYKAPNLTIIDPGSLIQSVNRLGVPHGIPALDRHQIIVNFRCYGAKHGLSNAETENLISEFTRGYSELFKLTQTQEVERFAELYWQTDLLNTLLGRDTPYTELTKRTIKAVDEKFGKTRFRSVK